MLYWFFLGPVLLSRHLLQRFSCWLSRSRCSRLSCQPHTKTFGAALWSKRWCAPRGRNGVNEHLREPIGREGTSIPGSYYWEWKRNWAKTFRPWTFYSMQENLAMRLILNAQQLWTHLKTVLRYYRTLFLLATPHTAWKGIKTDN